MRPERTRANSRTSATARARMTLKAEVGWLRGYPAALSPSGLDWRVLLPSELGAVEVDRRRINRTLTAVKRLNREFPRVLTQLVGERERWTERVEAVLEALKPCIHHGAPVPPAEAAIGALFSRRTRERFERALRVHRQQADVLRALAWSCALEESALSRALDELERLSPCLERARSRWGAEGVWHAVHGCRLVAAHGYEALEPLLELSADRRAFAVATESHDFVKRLERDVHAAVAHQSRVPAFVAPKARAGAEAAAGLSWLSGQPEDVRQRALGFVEHLVSRRALGEWESWWRAARALVGAAGHGVAESARLRDARGLAEWFARVKQLADDEPRPVRWRELFELVRWYTCDADGALTQSVARALDAIEEPEVRFVFAAQFRRLAATGKLSRVCRLAERLRAYLRATASLGAARYRPWAPLMERQAPPRYSHFDYELVETETSLARIDSVYGRLAAAALAGKSLSAREARRLLQLDGLELTTEAALELAELLETRFRAQYFSSAVLRRALACCDGLLERVQALLGGIASLDHERDREALLGVLEGLQRAGVGDQVDALLAEGYAQRLANVGQGFVEEPPERALPTFSSDPAPAWVARYPDEVRDAIVELSRVHPQAQKVVQRLFADVLPEPEALRRELRALDERIARYPQVEHLVRRRQQLEQRLLHPARPSAQKLGRLREKLEHARREALVNALEERAAALQVTRLRERFALDDVPDWLSKPELRRYLKPAFQLDPEMRALAVQLFRVRMGPKPWDLRDHPANRAFIERMRRRRVELTPWLDGLGVLETKAANGAELRVWLEDDPLRIFEMGAHFETCLSPEGFNYFSVFANAADVNKRVLYASDDQGRVLGRCLLALTPEGALLCFHPYCHDSGVDFPKVVRTVARELAAKMGTQLVPSGKVETLVAPRWYDDGPHDLGGCFECLEPKSPLRAQLASLGVEECARELEAALAPLGLNELTLSPLLELPEVRARVDVLAMLLGRVAALPNPGGALLVQAVALALEVGLAADARVWFGRRLEQFVARSLDPYMWLEPLRLLRALSPTRTLAVLRRSRRRHAAKWESLPAEMLEVAAQALEDLKRPQQAQRVYARAAQAAGNGETQERCAARARALAAGV